MAAWHASCSGPLRCCHATYMSPMAHVLAAAGSKLFKAGEIPVLPDMLEQIKVGSLCCCCCFKCTLSRDADSAWDASPVHDCAARHAGAGGGASAVVLCGHAVPCRAVMHHAVPMSVMPWLPSVQVSMWAMPLYAVLPTLTEYCVEQGWTMAYTRCAWVGIGCLRWMPVSVGCLPALDAWPVLLARWPGWCEAGGWPWGSAAAVRCGACGPDDIDCYESAPLTCWWVRLTCRVADVGLGRYVLYFALYMTSVEFFVYWQHRILHMGIGYRCDKQQSNHCSLGHGGCTARRAIGPGLPLMM